MNRRGKLANPYSVFVAQDRHQFNRVGYSEADLAINTELISVDILGQTGKDARNNPVTQWKFSQSGAVPSPTRSSAIDALVDATVSVLFGGQVSIEQQERIAAHQETARLATIEPSFYASTLIDPDTKEKNHGLLVRFESDETGATLSIHIPDELFTLHSLNAIAANGPDALDAWMDQHHPEIMQGVKLCGDVGKLATANKLDHGAYKFSGDHFPEDLHEVVQGIQYIASGEAIGIDPAVIEDAAATIKVVMPYLRCAAVTNASIDSDIATNMEFVEWFRKGGGSGRKGKPDVWVDRYSHARNFHYDRDGRDWLWDHAIIEYASQIYWNSTSGKTWQRPESMLLLGARSTMLDRRKQDELHLIAAVKSRPDGTDGVTQWRPIDGLDREDAPHGCISIAELERAYESLTDSCIEAVGVGLLSEQSDCVLQQHGYDGEMLVVNRAWNAGYTTTGEIQAHIAETYSETWDTDRIRRVLARNVTAARRWYGGRDPRALMLVRCGGGVKMQYLDPPADGSVPAAPGIRTYALEFDRGSGVMSTDLGESQSIIEQERKRQRRKSLKANKK